MKTPKNTEEEPDDPESAGEENIQMKYSLDYLYSLKIASVTENHLYEPKSIEVLSIIQHLSCRM